MENRRKNSLHLLPSLKNRSQFLALRKAPRFSCADFVLQGEIFHKEEAIEGKLHQPSVGFTVTKKIGNSVERNRIRRRLKHAVAEALKNKSLNNQGKKPHGGFQGEMVVVARPSSIDQNYTDLVSNFTKGIDRLAAKGNKAV